MSDNRIDARHFKDIFGFSMADISLSIGRSRESVSRIFRGLDVSEKLLEEVGVLLTEIADRNYEQEIAMAKYKKKKADEIIRFCYDRMKGD